MAVQVRLPQLAASMADGVVSKWLKGIGDSVAKGEPLFEVESDKVTTEVESPTAGLVRQILVPEGQKVDVGTVLAVIGGVDEAVPAATGAAASPATARATSGQPSGSGGQPSSAPSASVATKLFVTPRARMVAADLGVELTKIKGTGPGGRILERDVLGAASAPIAPPSPVPPIPPTPQALPAIAGQTMPLTGMRRTIAERMARSQQTVAEVTITTEVDMTEVVKLREQVGAEWQKQYGLKISPTDVIVKAVARGLREHPYLNASLSEEGIQLHGEINVGVAVALEGPDGSGLVVPVIRDADRKSLQDVAREARDLTQRARENRLNRDELTGGTFTVSNAGMYGVEVFTPIINWPECAILGVGRIAERAVVRDGQIIARPVMWLSLTFDHRIVDGAPAAQFLDRVRRLLESPYLLFV